jgi:hypothetical protein
MKAKINDSIQTLNDLIDLMIPNPQVIGGFSYENVILDPEQFIVITSQSQLKK